MARVLTLLALLAGLSGCGLAGTGAAGTAAATAEVQQAADAKKTEDQVRERLDAAAREAEQKRQSAETDTR